MLASLFESTFIILIPYFILRELKTQLPNYYTIRYHGRLHSNMDTYNCMNNLITRSS